MCNQRVTRIFVTKRLHNELPRRDVFQAISDPTRRAILGLLALQSLSVNAVAENFDISRPAVSKHVKVCSKNVAWCMSGRRDVSALRSPSGSARGGKRLGKSVPPVLGTEIRPTGSLPRSVATIKKKHRGKRNDSFRWEDKVIEHKRFIKAPRSWSGKCGPNRSTWPSGTVRKDTPDHRAAAVANGRQLEFRDARIRKDYQNDIRYTRIEPEHTLCFRNGAIDNPYGFDVQVTLEEQEGGTWLTMRSEFSSKAVIEELNQKVNAIEGGKQTLNKLVAYAEKLFSGS